MDMQEKIVDHLIKKYNPEAIIFHGSRAREAEREDSDWDLYVFVSDKEVKGGTELFEGQQLDVALMHTPIEEYDFVDTFGPTLRIAKILFDKTGIGERIMTEIKDIYGKDKKLTEQDILNRKRRFERMLSRIEGTIDNDLLFFYHTGSFFESVVRYWFEMRSEWPEPPYHALPIIKEKDSAYFELLSTIASDAPNTKRAEAYRRIYETLFEN